MDWERDIPDDQDDNAQTNLASAILFAPIPSFQEANPFSHGSPSVAQFPVPLPFPTLPAASRLPVFDASIPSPHNIIQSTYFESSRTYSSGENDEPSTSLRPPNPKRTEVKRKSNNPTRKLSTVKCSRCRIHHRPCEYDPIQLCCMACLSAGIPHCEAEITAGRRRLNFDISELITNHREPNPGWSPDPPRSEVIHNRKSLILKNPSNNEDWDDLVEAYQEQFARLPSVKIFEDKPVEGDFILAPSQLEKWFRFDLLKDPLRLEEFTDNGQVPRFGWIISLMGAPADHNNRLYLTWALTELSTLNTLHSLHTLGYDNAAFVRRVDTACQKYAGAFEFRIALAFASIASGQFHNGISQLRSIWDDVQTPKTYADVLRYTLHYWQYNLPILPEFKAHNIRDRAVRLRWKIPLTWLGENTDFADNFGDDSLALLHLQPDLQKPPNSNYGYFQSLAEPYIYYSQLQLRIRIDTIAILVNDYWGSLGSSILSIFRDLVAKILMREEGAIEELKLPGYDLTAFLAASATELTLIGYCCLAEWDCIVSCLRWLIAILGRPKRAMIIRSCKAGNSKSKSLEPHLRDSLPNKFSGTSVGLVYVQKEKAISKLFNASSLCWLMLFSEAYIGTHIYQPFTYIHRFEKTEIWKGKGLKLEFDVMIHAAGIEEVVQIDGTPILCGFKSALIPIVCYEDKSVQWHLIVAEGDDGPFRLIQHRHDFQSSLPVERLRNVEIDSLRGTAYVGWHKDGVTITLGTITPPIEISRTGLPIHEAISVPSGISVQLGAQVNTPFGGLVTVTRTYRSSSLAFSMPQPENFWAAVDHLFLKHVIVYDEMKKLALYAPLIHLVLFLLRAYLRDNDYPLHSIFGLQPNRRAIREFGPRMIVEGFSVQDALRAVYTRYSAVHSVLPPQHRLSSSGILGFEVADILGNNNTFFARKLAIEKGVRPWNLFAKTTDVVFCGVIGDMVQFSPGPDIVNPPKCCLRPPLGYSILIFPIPLLKTCFDTLDGNCVRQNGRKDLRWEPTASLFDGCKLGIQCDGSACFRERLQCVKRGKGVLKRKRPRNGYVTQKYSWMEGDEDGAVCFGRMA